MPLSCALPPLDQQHARVVATNAQGIDLVSFGARNEPTGAPVVSPLDGTIYRSGDLTRYGYRNAVVLQAPDGIFICLSGLAFGGRAESGQAVRAGTVIGQVEVPSSIDFLRVRDRTAGVNPRNPYLHMEVWNRLPPRFAEHLSTQGLTWTLESGVINPREFWPSIGIDFVGPVGSQTMAIRMGSIADCGNRS